MMKKILSAAIVSSMFFSSFAQNPILELTFDSTTVDQSQSQLAVTEIGNVSFTEDRNGKLNGAVLFDGTTRLDINDSEGLSVGNTSEGQLTLSFWFNIALGNTDLTALIEKVPSNLQSSFEIDYYLFLKASQGADIDKLVTAVGTSVDTNAFRYLDSPSIEEWHHYVMTIDNNGSVGEFISYMDGVEVNRSSYTQKGPANTNPLILGYEVKNKNYFKGAMDDFKVYDFVVSPSQVKNLYNDNSLGDLVLYLPFENSISDESEYQHSTSVSGDVTYTNGVFGGQAAYFNGASFLTVTHDDVLNIGNTTNKEYSISFYYKEEGTNKSPAGILEKSPNNVQSSSQVDYYVFLNGSGSTSETLVTAIGSSSDTSAFYQTMKPISDNWHYVVMNVSSNVGGTGVHTLYIDGELIRSEEFEQKGPATTNDLFFGRVTKTSTYFTGWLDEVKFYNYQLPVADIINNWSVITSLPSYLGSVNHTNPVSNELVLDQAGELLISSINGRVVLDMKVSKGEVINVTSFKKGMYVLKINGKTSKFIKE